MAQDSKIEWTEKTWNPVRGCSKVSEGCRNCYAMGVAARFSGLGQPYEGLAVRAGAGPQWTNRVVTVSDALMAPTHWREPKRVFVNSMSDLFHPDVPEEFIDSVFAVMAWTQRHTFQLLTKRPRRMQEYLSDPDRLASVLDQWVWMVPKTGNRRNIPVWPLPNVWVGTSVENQATADERIPELVKTPAAVRFLSCEPLLGPVRLNMGHVHSHFPQHIDRHGNAHGARLSIHWAIVGGESGPHARPMEADWARSLRDQCVSSEVAFFFKQWGGVNKKAAGRLLDGRTWDEYPGSVRAVAAACDAHNGAISHDGALGRG